MHIAQGPMLVFLMHACIWLSLDSRRGRSLGTIAVPMRVVTTSWGMGFLTALPVASKAAPATKAVLVTGAQS
jgi:hypothetical protein